MGTQADTSHTYVPNVSRSLWYLRYLSPKFKIPLNLQNVYKTTFILHPKIFLLFLQVSHCALQHLFSPLWAPRERYFTWQIFRKVGIDRSWPNFTLKWCWQQQAISWDFEIYKHMKDMIKHERTFLKCNLFLNFRVSYHHGKISIATEWKKWGRI